LVYDVLGQPVANGILDPGLHRVNFNATHFPSGVYFYEIKCGTQKKIIFFTDKVIGSDYLNFISKKYVFITLIL